MIPARIGRFFSLLRKRGHAWRLFPRRRWEASRSVISQCATLDQPYRWLVSVRQIVRSQALLDVACLPKRAKLAVLHTTRIDIKPQRRRRRIFASHTHSVTMVESLNGTAFALRDEGCDLQGWCKDGRRVEVSYAMDFLS